MKDSGKLWVGSLPTENVVFDPSAQAGVEIGRVRLWSAADEKYSLYYKDMVKPRVSTASPEIHEATLQRYSAFLAEQQAQLRASAERLHAKRARELGHGYAGVSLTDRKHRSTHCWSCYAGLESGINLECNACGWLLCSCGACGCGRV